MANDTAVPAPGDRARANAPLNRPLGSRRASAGGQWALVGVCKTALNASAIPVGGSLPDAPSGGLGAVA